MKVTTRALRKTAKPGNKGRTKFSADDRLQLCKVRATDSLKIWSGELGVTAEQIQELERVLPMCAALLGDVPPMSDVRDAMDNLHKVISTAQKTLAFWDKPAAKHIVEARARVESASFDLGTGREVDFAAKALAELCKVIVKSRDDLPKKSRRQRRAAPDPVRLIYRALKHGWGLTYYPVWHGDETRFTTPPPPPFLFTPSKDSDSPFYQIVCICYRAIVGDPDIDPVRAVAAFVNELERDELERRRTEDPPTS